VNEKRDCQSARLLVPAAACQRHSLVVSSQAEALLDASLQRTSRVAQLEHEVAQLEHARSAAESRACDAESALETSHDNTSKLHSEVTKLQMLLQEAELTSQSHAGAAREAAESARAAAEDRERLEAQLRALERELQEVREQHRQFMNHPQSQRFEEQQQFGGMAYPTMAFREQPPLPHGAYPHFMAPAYPGAPWGAQIPIPTPVQQPFALPPVADAATTLKFGSHGDPPPPFAAPQQHIPNWAPAPSTPPGFQRAPGGEAVEEQSKYPRPRAPGEERREPGGEPRVQYITPMPPSRPLPPPSSNLF